MLALKRLPLTNVAMLATSPRPIEDVIKRAVPRPSRRAMVARIAAAPPGWEPPTSPTAQATMELACLAQGGLTAMILVAATAVGRPTTSVVKTYLGRRKTIQFLKAALTAIVSAVAL